MHLYKYRNFSENHINSLVNNQMWFAIGETFNDPFDSKPPLTLFTYRSMAGFLHKQPNSVMLNEAQFHQLVSEELDRVKQLEKEGRIHEHQIWPYAEVVIAATLRRFIFCLSRCNRNILMWSHYANSHTGFCVRYDLDVLTESLDLYHHQYTDYTTEMPDILSRMMNGGEENRSEDFLYIKAPDWSYEREYRLLLNDFAEGPDDRVRCVEHPPEAVDRVYFGLNADAADIDRLRNALEGREIGFFKMQRGRRSIELFAQRI